ncbi:hypothetical protein [Pseudoteredinibacter isoporae]|uniref:Uncharacterized protein n=1 Tax=Pseudoteredinibacter isoporae TaxID=570281 RepID=A0A7X0MX05_9GAMM|nr:hypothetical protein [Pseudoteredinibacter isoporae]MBB6520382.1 hypothetical protein [Pseudoteredinibacter isoporae]NHO85951.1 hypothetical protein [Pseudoteredinibacter isoporae]NIB25597.1 hypothetical protein [Pseudoteredinibacter isoporae]
MKTGIFHFSFALALGLLSIASKAQMYLDPNGKGQLLMYPFYTAAADNDTYISLINSTDDFKAVSVRVLQAHDGRSVASLYLYLSPHDHWSAVITKTSDNEGARIRTADISCTIPTGIAAEKIGNIGEDLVFEGAENDTASNNEIGHIEVIEMGTLNYQESGDKYLHPLNNNTFSENDKNAIDSLKNAIKHTYYAPNDCSLLTTAWQAPSENTESIEPSSSAFYYPDTDDEPGDFTQARVPLAPPSGGLFGYGVIINVPDGTAAQYKAIAINNFMSGSYHPTPGGNEPGIDDGIPSATLRKKNGRKAVFLAGPLADLASNDIRNSRFIPSDKVSLLHVNRTRGATSSRLAGGGQIIAAIKDNNSRDSFNFYGDHRSNSSFVDVSGGEQGLGLPGSKEALSALLGRSRIINDYVLEPALNANTNWLITFPTARDFIAVAPDSTNEYITQRPFGTLGSQSGFPCPEITFEFWNREADGDTVLFDVNSGTTLRTSASPTLCSSANVVSFAHKTSMLNDDKSGSQINLNIPLSKQFSNGWAKLGFPNAKSIGRAGTPGQETEKIPPITVNGLPAIGFAIQKYVNNSATSAGALANYAVSKAHQYSTDIESGVSP